MTKELRNQATKEHKNSVSLFLSSSVFQLTSFSVLQSLCFSVASAGGVIEDAPRLSTVGLNILQFLLSIVGIIAIIAIVVAGIFYLTAAGNERQIERSKKALVYSIVGIVVALAAMVIVKTIAKIIS